MKLKKASVVISFVMILAPASLFTACAKDPETVYDETLAAPLLSEAYSEAQTDSDDLIIIPVLSPDPGSSRAADAASYSLSLTSTPSPSPSPSPSPTPIPIDPAYEADPYSYIASLPCEDGQISVYGGAEINASDMELLEQRNSELLYSHAFLMLDINTGRGVGFNIDEIYYLASSIKGPYAASLCDLNPESAASFEGTIISMLQYSDNDAYRILDETYHRTYIQQWINEIGLDPYPFGWKYPHIGARQMAALWLRCFEFFDSGDFGQQAGSWFEMPENSAIRDTVGDRYTTRSKGGWLVEEDNYDHTVSIDAGIVYADNGPYIVVIMSHVPSSLAYLEPIMEAIDNIHSAF